MVCNYDTYIYGWAHQNFLSNFRNRNLATSFWKWESEILVQDTLPFYRFEKNIYWKIYYVIRFEFWLFYSLTLNCYSIFVFSKKMSLDYFIFWAFVAFYLVSYPYYWQLIWESVFIVHPIRYPFLKIENQNLSQQVPNFTT